MYNYQLIVFTLFPDNTLCAAHLPPVNGFLLGKQQKFITLAEMMIAKKTSAGGKGTGVNAF